MNVSQARQRTDQYVNHLGNRAKFTKGWNLSVRKPSGQPHAIRLTCIHGRRYDERLVTESLADFPDTKGLADQHFRRAIKWCKGEHVYLTPNTWFSGPLKPLANSYYNGPVAVGGVISFDPSSYSANTGSILNELINICPGLATVSRPCPEGCTPYSQQLAYLIPHINDQHQWSREKIAAWLDIIALDDPSVDLTIKPKKEVKSEQPSIGPSPEAWYAEYEAIDKSTIANLLKL